MNHRLLSAAAVLLAALPLSAATPPEELLRQEIRETVARVMASEAFAGRGAEALAFSLSLPAERYLDLGLLLDRRDPASAGLVVLGTTPGGSAQALGLRAGDVITTVGEVSLAGLGMQADGTAQAVMRLKSVLDGMLEGGRLTMDVLRDGRSVRFDGAVAARYLPPLRIELGEGNLVGSIGGAAAPLQQAAATAVGGDGSCGRISTFHVAPRSQRLYPARVLAVDGSIPGPAQQDTYRLPPGTHTIEVAEDINPGDLPTAFSRRRAESGRKTFTVVVEPGTTHLVAARLLDGSGARDYWEPVVWKTLPEACR
jgi:hypothetical protein